MSDIITLEGLYAENFKCHKELDIDLSQNKLVVLVGRNGTGKTSILDAIFWCLYDETIKGLKGDSVVTHKVGKDCYVRLTFSINSTKYEIHNYRKHTKFKNTKILIRDGKQISTDMDVAETNNIIQNIFMPKDIFTNSLLFSTFVRNSFTELTHSGQKDILDQLLGFEKYNEMHQKVSTAIVEENNVFSEKKKTYDKLKYELDGLKAQLPRDIELYTEIQNNTKARGIEYEEKIKLAKKQISSLTYSEEEYNSCNKALEKSKEEISKVNNKIDNINSQIDTEKKSIRETQHNLYQAEIQAVKDSIIVKIDDIKNKESDYFQNTYNTQLINAEKEYLLTKNSLDNFNSNTQSKLDNIEKRLLLELNKVEEPYTEAYKGILDAIYKLELEIRTLSNRDSQDRYSYNLQVEELKNIKENKDFCTLCKQPLSDKTHIDIKRKELSSEIKELEKVISTNLKTAEKFNIDLKVLNSEKTKIEEQIQSKKDALYAKADSASNKVRSSSEDELKDINNKLQIENEKISKLKKEFVEKQNTNNSEIQKLKEQELYELNCIKYKYKEQYDNLILELNKKTESSRKELETLKSIYQDDIDKFIKSLEDLVKNKSVIETATTSINLYMDEVKKLKEIFKRDGIEYKKNIDTLKKKIEVSENEFKIIEEEFDKIKENINILTFWKKAFSDIGIKSVLLDESIPFLNKRAKELSDLTEYIRISFSSQTVLKSGKTNNKFSINAINSKYLSEYEEFSAGEMRLTNIIILLCLRDLMEKMAGKKINLLLLDEILDSLDEQNSEIAAKIIQHLSKDFFVLLITHTHKSSILSDEEIRL